MLHLVAIASHCGIFIVLHHNNLKYGAQMWYLCNLRGASIHSGSILCLNTHYLAGTVKAKALGKSVKHLSDVVLLCMAILDYIDYIGHIVLHRILPT